jgi:hypothetical protein
LHIAHELSSYLSLKAIYSTPFPLITYICGGLYMELFGKVWSYQDIINEMLSKLRQASHGLTETRQKGHWKIMLYQGGGEKNTHT